MPLNTFAGLGFDFALELGKLTLEQRDKHFKFKEEFFVHLEESDSELLEVLVEAKKLQVERSRGVCNHDGNADDIKGNIVVGGIELYDQEYLASIGVELPDDWTLLRFLTSDSFDIKLALKRCINCVIWRWKEGINKMREPPCFDKYLTNRICRIVGHTFEDLPIVAERFGETMAVENVSIMSIDEWIKCVVYDTEQLILTLRKTSLEKQKPIGKTVTIYDMENIKYFAGLKNISFLKKLDATLSVRYPELVERLIVVNAPAFVDFAFNRVIKSFLDPVTVYKTRIHSSIFFTKLQINVFEEICDIRQLPACYGGENLFGSDFPHRDGFR